MKTIEEAAVAHARIHYTGQFVSRADPIESFNAGVEFAQRWIPIEEEFPEPASFVVAKKKNGIILGLYYNADKEFMYNQEDQTSQVTHWRPIELI